MESLCLIIEARRKFVLGRMNRIIKHKIAGLIKGVTNHFGYEVRQFPQDITKEDMEIINYSIKYTVLDHSTIKSMIDAVKYLESNNIKGSFVECGVLKGGMIIAMIKTLQQLGINDREFYLYDTFYGMANPSEFDTRVSGEAGVTGKTVIDNKNLLGIPLPQVKKNVLGTGYDASKIHFVEGMVEDTLPKNDLHDIALLRLDTDFYNSTKAELEYLYPKLSTNGILIIDDYGVWAGAKKATDEYFIKNQEQIFLSRIHPLGGRIGIKPK